MCIQCQLPTFCRKRMKISKAQSLFTILSQQYHVNYYSICFALIPLLDRGAMSRSNRNAEHVVFHWSGIVEPNVQADHKCLLCRSRFDIKPVVAHIKTDRNDVLYV